MSMIFSPTTPQGWLLLDVQARLERARQRPEKGASAIELVIISAALIAIAGALVFLIRGFVKDESQKIK